MVGDTHRECTNCGIIFEISSRMTMCKKCNCERVKSFSPQFKMVQRAKERCKKSGVEFDITTDDISIPDYCPVLGIALNMNSGKSGAFKNSPSLDRIDNNRGYTRDNIQVISQMANAMKGGASIEELQMFANWINKLYPQDTT